MKNFLLVVALLLSTSAIAVVRPVPLLCSDAKTVVGILQDEYGEQPYWAGKTATDAKTILFVNTKSKTWSFVYFMDEKTACLMSSGINFKIVESI